jgi:septal ring-binding cell division protein DamX
MHTEKEPLKLMLFDLSICKLSKKSFLQCVVLFSALLSPAVLQAEDNPSYAAQIEEYVNKDKVYLLENIRQNVKRPSERTIIDALLSEDAPLAVALYRKQLKEYPDSLLDKLSLSRIAAYNLARESSAASPKPSALLTLQPHPVTVQQDTTKAAITPHSKVPDTATGSIKDTTRQVISRVKTTPDSLSAEQNNSVAPTEIYTLQFGCFSNRANAKILAKKIAGYAPIEIVVHGQMYKVLLKQTYASNHEAAIAAKKVPVHAIVVPVK